MKKKLTGLWLSIILGFLAVNPVMAADKPFAEHKVVLQISDGNPFKQTLVLNVANNLMKAYGVDKVDVQVVAFGPGLRLLFADNVNKGRIQSLVDNAGVEFHACKNTIANMSSKLGHPVAINPVASTNSGGVAKILELRKKGYELIKP
jgi:intracellular sulfur oxidation DsrE/DsrF family protein